MESQMIHRSSLLLQKCSASAFTFWVRITLFMTVSHWCNLVFLLYSIDSLTLGSSVEHIITVAICEVKF
jgi:hypothetical protein